MTLGGVLVSEKCRDVLSIKSGQSKLAKIPLSYNTKITEEILDCEFKAISTRHVHDKW